MGWRINDLQGAALPLTGQEILELEQGGNSRQVRVMDLLPGFEDTLAADLADPTKGAGMVAFGYGSVADRFKDAPSVKDYGAIADGTNHPLSERFATLIEAQSVYPFASSLSQSIDWAATQAALNAGGFVDFFGAKRSYVITDMLEVTKPNTTLNLAGCAITAQAGFSGPHMLKISASGCKLKGGATINAAGMPAVTKDFTGVDFTGFAIAHRGTSAAPYSGFEVSGALYIRNAPAAALGVEYVNDFHVKDVFGYDCDNSATYIGPGVLYFNRCSEYTLGNLKAKNFKWKGIYNTNGSDFIASDLHAADGVSNQASIFFRACTGFEVTNMQGRRSFGVKFDNCTDFTASGFDFRCGSIGECGVMVQGCVGYELSDMVIRDYTISGIDISSHPGPPPLNVLVGKISGFKIRNGTAASDAAIRLFGSSSETAGNVSISDGYIYSCQRGLKVRNTGTAVLNRHVAFSDITIDTFAVAAVDGLARETSISDLRLYNAGAAAVGLDLYLGASQVCDLCTLDGIDAPYLPSTVPFIRLASTLTKPINIGLLNIKGCSGTGGSRFLEVNLTQATDALRSLTLSGNHHNGAASVSAVQLSNAVSSVNCQVAITGNQLLTAAYAKAAINFVDTAASGKWNGVVENNMCTVTNKPNNV